MNLLRSQAVPVLLAILALAGALTGLQAAHGLSAGADLNIFLSSPISPVVTPTGTVVPTPAITPTGTVVPTPTITPTATPTLQPARCYLPLVRGAGRAHLWLPVITH